ncbi:restriction endonuclease subunit S [Bacteroides fragilis]|nr:restriction endonuclease subunit S [Bacteroides fragilis]
MELKEYKLGDIAEIIVSSINKKSKEEEELVKLCNFVDVYHNWAISTDMVQGFMNATASEKNIERFSLRKGYVAFTKDSETRNDIGMSTYIADSLGNTVLGYHCALVKPNEKILSGKYLNAFLHSSYIKKYFELNATGSGMRYTLSMDTLNNIPVLIPSLEIQEHIGGIFSDIDCKICLNRAINHNLEAMMKQLYNYWFVQFDFPNEEGKPYKSNGGEMVWNEELKREIPQGWSSMSIGDYAPCKSGYAFKSKDFGSKGLPVIKIGNIQENYTLNMTDSQCIDLFNNTLFLAKRYDLVIAMTGATIGKFAISQRNYWVNQRVGRFDLGDRPLLRLGFLFNSLKQEYFREQVFQIACGCAQPNISAEQIDSISVLKPNDIILNQFNKLCEPLLELQSENYLEVEKLTKQRNELLPLLMNGQVSVNYDLSHD